MSATLTERLSQEYASWQRLRPAAAVTASRQAAIEALSAHGLPSGRDENWKYANLRPLERLRFVPALAALDTLPALPAAVSGFTRYVFIDGALSAAASQPLGNGVERLTDPAGALGAARPTRDERFALLNEAFASDGARIVLPPGSAPLRLEFLFIASADTAAGASYPTLRVELGSGTQLELIERHLSCGDAASFVNSAVSVALAEGAVLRHYRLQDLNRRSVLFDTLMATLGAGGDYRLQGVSTGALAARSTLSLRHSGPNSALDLALAALGDRQQVQDIYAVVEHAAPATRTTQSFRGIAAGRARVACNGKIVVAKNARGTDSRQSLRGLLAGPEAEIDVRPQLEIYTDDVRCSHGATAGKLDENMLFYLLSRGLDRASAQRLLKWAFLEDVIAQTAVPELRRQTEERLTTLLQDDTLRELL